MRELFIKWTVDPVLLYLGPLQIRWYSLLFVLGFILGYQIFRYFFKREKLNPELLDPLLYTLLLGTIIGARLGHCLFYQPDYYLTSWQGFIEIFEPWKGGLASHGGAIALIICMYFFAKHYGKSNGFDFLWLLDHLAIPVCFAACFIRLGNLFNSEIYGDVTNLPWGFIYSIRGETLPKHPTQIYEALAYLILGLVLLYIYKTRLNKCYRGFFAGIFFIVSCGMRFLIEFIKEPQVDFEKTLPINMGQMLSIPFIIIGIALVIYAYKTKKPAISENALKM